MNKIKLALIATTLLSTANADININIAKFMARSEKISTKDNAYIQKIVKLNGIECVKEFWKKGVSPKAFKIIERKSCKIILFKTKGVKCINIQPK